MSVKPVEGSANSIADHKCSYNCANWVRIALAIGGLAFIVFGILATYQVGVLSQLPHATYLAYASYAIAVAILGILFISVTACASDEEKLANEKAHERLEKRIHRYRNILCPCLK